MLTLINRFSKYSIVILGFLAITLSYAQEDRAEDISILDVDANGEVDALTDGVLLLRSMFGLTDDVLTTGVVSSDATVSDATSIDSYITSMKDTTYGKLNANDDQNISGSSLSGTTLTIGIEDGASETVDLSSLEDGTGITPAQASAIIDNTAKVGITANQASSIIDNNDMFQSLVLLVNDNTAKTGITSAQVSAITDNTAKTGITSGQASAITDNTAKTGITSGQANAITANTAKTGITSGQASAITDNTAKTGITSSQASAITDNTAKKGITSGQASAITDNTAKTGITSSQAGAITANSDKTGITPSQANAIIANTAKTVLALGTSSSTALAGNTAYSTLALGTSSSTALAGNTTTITSNQANAISANSHTIGERYGGGIVFYIYDGGQHGLIAATTDTGFSQSISWHEERNKRINARSDGIGAGAANTAIMITKRGEYSQYSNYVTPSAATLWHQYPPATGGWPEADGVIYGDWYLPSKHELSLMIGNNSAASLNLTGSAGYWSSNENVSGFKPNEAWRHLLGSNADSVAKSSYARVRMIREF